MRRHDLAHHVAARFPSDDDALDAVHDLDALPGHEHLRLEVHRGADHEVERAETQLVSRVVVCMVVGVPIGVALGFAIMMAIDLWIEPMTVGLITGVGIPAGGLFGLLVGGIAGLAWGAGELEKARAIGCLHLAEHEDVVVAEMDTAAVRRELPSQIREVFAAHQGELLHL